MKKTIAKLFLAIVASGCLLGCQQKNSRIPNESCNRGGLTAKEVFDRSKNSVAIVKNENTIGSAFVFKQEKGKTYLATNAHVTRGSNSVSVKWINGRIHQASVMKEGDAESNADDLAILQIDDLVGKRLDLQTVTPSIGSEIFAIGNPEGLEFSISKGIVSSIRDEGRIIQMDVPINSGNSGGAVLDQSGCVIGVATAKIANADGLAFAISSQRFRDFDASSHVSRKPRVPEPESNQPSRPPTEPQPSGITQAHARAIVEQWLTVKSQIFAPPFDTQLADQVVASGPLWRDLTKENGSIQWLKLNNSYYTYQVIRVNRVIRYMPSPDIPSIVVSVTETSVLNSPKGAETSSNTNDWIYSLKKENGRWKIWDYRKQ